MKLKAIKSALEEIKSQAEEGLRVNHDCPAVFACASILNDCNELLSRINQSEKGKAQHEN